ncbi:hypothetical protein HPB49_019491 [Dermacentor silvarum]|uniref:Uncharacterized protein n=1 Tax=Dermacentor silvarum TaxID=543639 RepID=A0ACB8CSU4_DERSI|nr:hypothetical protein HPB49_019491 [Dermacentor silvarum]
MGISAGNLAELLADQIAARPPALQAPPPEAAARSIPSSCHHADWTGFRRQRCTADSISDVVATLEDAKATGYVAMVVLLDVKSAFDGLPHAVIEACLDRLGLIERLPQKLHFRIPDRQNLLGAHWTGT